MYGIDLILDIVNGSDISVEEGKTAIVCASIISPEAVDRSVLLLARTLPVTAVGKWIISKCAES